MAQEKHFRWVDIPGVKHPALNDTHVIRTMYQEPKFGLASTGNCGVAMIQNVAFGQQVLSWGWPPDASQWGQPPADYCKLAQKHIREMAGKDEPEVSVRQTADAITRAAKKTGYNCFIMTDSANKYSKERGLGPRIDWTTLDFAEFLWEHKIGYVVRGPLSINHAHQRPGDVSFARVWIWFPPSTVVFKDSRYLGHGESSKTAQEAYDSAVKLKHPIVSAFGTDQARLLRAFKGWDENR
jgi:hypothetical protein